jgi:hypothetical protein
MGATTLMGVEHKLDGQMTTINIIRKYRSSARYDYFTPNMIKFRIMLQMFSSMLQMFCTCFSQEHDYFTPSMINLQVQ